MHVIHSLTPVFRYGNLLVNVTWRRAVLLFPRAALLCNAERQCQQLEERALHCPHEAAGRWERLSGHLPSFRGRSAAAEGVSLIGAIVGRVLRYTATEKRLLAVE